MNRDRRTGGAPARAGGRQARDADLRAGRQVTKDEWHGLQKRSARSRVSGDIRLRLHYRQGLCSPGPG